MEVDPATNLWCIWFMRLLEAVSWIRACEGLKHSCFDRAWARPDFLKPLENVGLLCFLWIILYPGCLNSKP